jgi:signal transduction histidine kinase
LAFPADSDHPAELGAMAGSTEPAWLWQPGTGALLWGNAGALALWGVDTLAALQALKIDRAMPALSQLQRLQWALGSDVSHRETLVLWLPAGSRSLACLCRKVSFAGNDAAILVTLAGHEVPVSAPVAALGARHLNGHAIAAPPRSQPDLAPEDAATLAEIARMIRQRSPVFQPAVAPEQPVAAAETQAQALDAAFLARLSHELRTPLNAIMGYAELLRAERDGPLGSGKYHAYADHILESAAHCLNLANDLSDPAKLGAGVRTQEFSEVDVNDTVRVCIGILAPIATKAGVALEESLDVGVPRAILDRRSLRQILLNLVANAIKATPAGRTITLATHYRPGTGLELSVTDEGRGMAPARLAEARGQANGGGLGLPLSRKLAEANGASLEIDSREGHGTRVTLDLPMARLVT